MKKLFLLATVIFGMFATVVYADSYVTPAQSNQPSISYEWYWKDSKFFITNWWKKAVKVINFINVPQKDCTTVNDTKPVCVVKDVNLLHILQRLNERLQSIMSLQRQPVCLDIDTFVKELKEITTAIENTKTIIDSTSTSTSCTEKSVEWAIVNDIVYEKWKTVYKEVYRFRLPATGASI